MPDGRITLAQSKVTYYTLYSPLPNDVLKILESSLDDIAPCCTDVAGRSDKAWYSPHISLCYFGLASPELKSKVQADADMFKEILKGYLPIRVVMRGFTIFEDRTGQLRLSWNIVDETPLVEAHCALKGVGNYPGFPEIDGRNYHPHVIVAKANMQIPNVRTIFSNFVEANKDTVPVEAAINSAFLQFVDQVPGADQRISTQVSLTD